MQKTLSFLATSTLLLSACNQETPIVGGPCEYVTLSEEAVFAKAEDDLIILKADNRDYVVESKFFDTVPEEGDRFMVTSDQITKGTCTPVMIGKVEKL